MNIGRPPSVSAHSADYHWMAVDQHLAIAYLDLPETHPATFDIDGGAGFIPQHNYHGVKIRYLR